MPEHKPVILSYCATFLPREMMHVFRQVSGVRKFENRVITRKRANPERFPYPHVHVLHKSPLRALARIYHRARKQLVPVGGSETRQMLQIVHQSQAALVHVYLGSEALRLLGFLKKCPCARVVSFHGGDLSEHYPAEWYQSLWPLAELILCRSESLKQVLLDRGCPAEKLRLNFTGVPVPAEPRSRSLQSRGAREPLRLLQACRFIDKKGLDISLTAIRQLTDRGLAVKLTLAGEGPEEEALRSLAGELGIAERVEFVGFLSEDALRESFNTHDIFIHPSRTTAKGDREGIPNALLEAMAWGMPVVSTRHSGIPEAITDGETGLLIADADATLLADAIARLNGDPGFYDAISKNAAAMVRVRFSIDSCIKNLETIYEEAMKRNLKPET